VNWKGGVAIVERVCACPTASGDDVFWGLRERNEISALALEDGIFAPSRSKRSLTEGSSEAVCHPIRSSASSELPKTSSRMIRSVASFKYSSNTFSI
jgi:hypothetical protein